MEPPNLDDVDRGILHLLQVDARNHSASVIADEVGVAPNTVRNRIDRLQEDGVIQGYHPNIDYECAGFQLQVFFVCSAPVSQRAALADRALEVPGVIEVHEILSGHQNIAVRAVGASSDDLTAIATALEDRGLAIDDENFVRRIRVQPFDHFGIEVVEE